MPTLDELYLDYRERTAPVFDRWPELEALRMFIFRLVSRGGEPARPLDWLRVIAATGKRMVGRGKPRGPAARVLLLLEGGREVLREPVLAVARELTQRGVNLALLEMGPAPRHPFPRVTLRPAPVLAVPRWARESWIELVQLFPDLRKMAAWRRFAAEAVLSEGVRRALVQVLSSVAPKATVHATNNTMLGGLLPALSRRLGILSVLLQHGTPQAFYTPVLDDVMLTWGPRSNRLLSGLGVDPLRLRVVGSPRHDDFVSVDRAEVRQKFLRHLQIPDRPTLVYFSNGNDLSRNGAGPWEAARWMEDAAYRVPDVNVVARLHPNEDGRLFAACRATKILRPDQVDTASTIAASDAVASQVSTALEEAVLLRKPVWQLEAATWPRLADNWREGLALRISSSDELLQAVTRLRGGEPPGHAHENALPFLFANVGRAAKSAADAIVELCEDRNTVNRD